MSFALTGFAIVGCGPQAPALKTAPVAGTVTYNGNAVEGAQVVFSPVNKNDRSAVGTTDASGRFTVQTPVGGEKMAKGALAGDYSVVVVKNLSAAAAVDMKSGTPEENVKKAEEMMRKTPGAVGEESQKGTGAVKGHGDTGVKTGLPQKYADDATTPLKATVPPGGKEDFTFELTD